MTGHYTYYTTRFFLLIGIVWCTVRVGASLVTMFLASLAMSFCASLVTPLCHILCFHFFYNYELHFKFFFWSSTTIQLLRLIYYGPCITTYSSSCYSSSSSSVSYTTFALLLWIVFWSIMRIMWFNTPWAMCSEHSGASEHKRSYHPTPTQSTSPHDQ